jgi:hypothetical protein
MTNVVVGGALANKPLNGGEAWVRLSYLRGLQRLGARVFFVEEIDRPACTDDVLAWRADVLASFDLLEFSALVDTSGRVVDGREDALHEALATADLVVNISGHLRVPSLVGSTRRTAYVDIDPGYTQIWHASGALRIIPHDVYFTIAENIGRPQCSIPTGGIEWRPTWPPVVLDDWPYAATGDGRFTTIASWRAPYGRLQHVGRTYGIKLDEFRKLLPLPAYSPATFELALDIHPNERPDLAALDENGWQVVEAGSVAADPDMFRRYVQGSAAEFSVAQGVYVGTNSGWFSDRTTRYLATGKPALVQDTGFSERISSAEGLISFRSLEDAVAGADAILADYALHSRAARRLAEKHFDSDKILTRLLEDALP